MIEFGMAPTVDQHWHMIIGIQPRAFPADQTPHEVESSLMDQGLQVRLLLPIYLPFYTAKA